MTKVKFKVLELCDTVKQGSELRVGNIYNGWLVDGRVYYTDKANCEWVFWPGDTCDINLP